MIEVRIILHSAVTHTSKELGRAYIANDGTGTLERGNYIAAVCRKGGLAVPAPIYDDGKPAMRSGVVRDYPRKSYSIWRLVTRALLTCFSEEK